jgi:hypothetical protein
VSGIPIAIAASFAPIHARNNIAQGALMGDHAVLVWLPRGEAIPIEAFAKGYVVLQRISSSTVVRYRTFGPTGGLTNQDISAVRGRCRSEVLSGSVTIRNSRRDAAQGTISLNLESFPQP